mgnify:CR=1 FL=1
MSGNSVNKAELNVNKKVLRSLEHVKVKTFWRKNIGNRTWRHKQKEKTRGNWSLMGGGGPEQIQNNQLTQSRDYYIAVQKFT